jgi:hypothetical protein
MTGKTSSGDKSQPYIGGEILVLGQFFIVFDVYLVIMSID